MLLCQFLVPAGNSFWLYILLCIWSTTPLFSYNERKFYYDRKKIVLVICLAGCAVVSVFGSGDYDRKKKILVLCLAGCAVVSVFGSGDYDRKKKF